MSSLQTLARRYRRTLHVVLGLAAVGMLLWGRLILQEAPRTATADGPTLARSETSGSLTDPRADPAADGAVPPAANPITRPGSLLDVKRGKLGFIDDQGSSGSKSDPSDSDDFDWMQAAETAAAEFNLQGVTTGKVPGARINGRMIRVGETIGGYTLRSVSGQTAVLERAGAAFRLTVRNDASPN